MPSVLALAASPGSSLTCLCLCFSFYLFFSVLVLVYKESLLVFQLPFVWLECGLPPRNFMTVTVAGHDMKLLRND